MIFTIMFACNFIGATTGGSALLTIPACILLGFSPQAAVATTRVGVLGSTVAGWYGFNKEGKVNYKIAICGALCGAVGALIGARVMVNLSPVFLERIIGILMIVTLIITIAKKKFLKPRKASSSKFLMILGYFSLLTVGFLSGMFGGQGVIMNYILVLLFSQSFLEAAGTRSIINFVIAVVAVFVYQTHDAINWPFVAVIICSMALGSYLGAIYGIKKGDKWVEKIFNIVVIIMSIKLIVF